MIDSTGKLLLPCEGWRKKASKRPKDEPCKISKRDTRDKKETIETLLLLQEKKTERPRSSALVIQPRQKERKKTETKSELFRSRNTRPEKTQSTTQKTTSAARNGANKARTQARTRETSPKRELEQNAVTLGPLAWRAQAGKEKTKTNQRKKKKKTHIHTHSLTDPFLLSAPVLTLILS
jgi:hypothetical protein